MKTLHGIPALSLLLLTSPALGTGFMIFEHGASATGMADSRTALADDPNALFFNPSAITELPGLQLELGLTGILPYIDYQAQGRPENPRTYLSRDDAGLPIEKTVNDGENSTSTKMKGFTPLHLYAAYGLPDLPIHLGYGLNNPFGLGVYWPEKWDGRFIAIEADMATFFHQPVVALDLARLLGAKRTFRLSIAAGYVFVHGTAQFGKGIDLRVAESFYGVQNPFGEMRMKGSAIGHGFVASLRFEVPDVFAVGAAFRSRVQMDFAGQANFRFNWAGDWVRSTMGLAIPDETTGRVTIQMPMNANVGVAILAVKNLKLTLDYFMVFCESYKELAFRFDCANDPANPCNDLNQPPIPANWGLGWQVSIGAEYLLRDWLVLRLGYGHVGSPVPDDTWDPSFPDGDKTLLCGGGGVRGEWWKLDVGYMASIFSHTKANEVGAGDPATGNPNGLASGHYSTVAHLLALSFTIML